MSSRVAPFGYPRINGYLLLPEAFRSLSRPSSAPDAKAFPLRSFQLDRRKVRSFVSSELALSRSTLRLVLRCENSWFSLRIMQALQRSKLYVTLHPFGCCSTINLFPHVSPHEKPLCCLTCFCHIVQFSRCRSPSASFRLSPAQLPTAFAVRFEDPIFRSGLQIQRQIAWWARVGSNHRPYDYQSYALAS